MKKFSVVRRVNYHREYCYIINNETQRIVDDFATPNGDVVTTFRDPRAAMKVAAMLNANPDMPLPQTEFNRQQGVPDWNNIHN